jgi:hypothetical protein
LLGGFSNCYQYPHLHNGGLQTRWVVASSFFSSVIGGGFGGGGMQRLKLHTGKEGFVGSTSLVHRSTERNCIDPHSAKVKLFQSHWDVFEYQINQIQHEKQYSHSYKDKNSKQERQSLNVLIVSHEPLHCDHISEWDKAEEQGHHHN